MQSTFSFTHLPLTVKGFCHGCTSAFVPPPAFVAVITLSFLLAGCQPHPTQHTLRSTTVSTQTSFASSTSVFDLQQSNQYRQATAQFAQKDYAAALNNIESLLRQPRYAHNPTVHSFLLKQAVLCRHAIDPHAAAAIPIETVASDVPRHFAQADCGPRALLLLCPRLGVKTDINTLRRAAGTTGQGTTLQGLKRAAQAAGLKATGVQVDKAALSHVSLPAIAWYDSNHYVALLHVSEEQVTIHDPNQTKEETLSTNEFLGRSTGLLLTVSR